MARYIIFMLYIMLHILQVSLFHLLNIIMVCHAAVLIESIKVNMNCCLSGMYSCSLFKQIVSDT